MVDIVARSWSASMVAVPVNVAGAVALLWSADPSLIGDLDRTEEILATTAQPLVTSASCEGPVASPVEDLLATVGTGDVLTGMVAALIARGLDPETAARSAAHRHGRAAAALDRDLNENYYIRPGLGDMGDRLFGTL